jgi:alpha-galactosidase
MGDYANWLSPVLSNGKDTIRLTSLKWVKAFAQTGKVRNSKAATGSPLMVNGRNYTDGIGTGANSVIGFDIPEGYMQFSSNIAIDDAAKTQTPGGTVRFFVFTEDPAGLVPPDIANVKVSLTELGFSGPCRIRDLWSGMDLGKFTGNFSADIKKHGAGMYRISPVKK